MTLSVGVAILAGGKSRRMGEDKASLRLQQKPMISHVLDRVSPIGAHDIVIVSNTPEKYDKFGVRSIADSVPDCGPIGGILSAFEHTKQDNLIIVGCDMPLLIPDVLNLLIQRQKPTESAYHAVIPREGKKCHYLHGLYHRSCKPYIIENITENQLSISKLLENLAVRYVDEKDYAHIPRAICSFTNINTPHDLALISQHITHH